MSDELRDDNRRRDLDAIARFASHDAIESLHIIRLHAAIMARKHPTIRNHSESIVQAVRTIETRMRRLRDYLHAPRSTVGPSSVADLSLPTGLERSINVETLPVDLPTAQRCVDELVNNARLHGAAPVRLFLEPCDGGVAIRVRDAGPGLAPELRERATQLLDTLGVQGRAGVGLAWVHRYATERGGCVRLIDEAHTGFTVSVEFPTD